MKESRQIKEPKGCDFFISYGHGYASSYAYELATELRAHAYASFLDQWGIKSGISENNLREKLHKEITDCTSMILLIDPHAVRSQWVAWEINQFLKIHSRKVFVIRFGRISIPKELTHSHFRHLREPIEALTQGKVSDKVIYKLIKAHGDEPKSAASWGNDAEDILAINKILLETNRPRGLLGCLIFIVFLVVVGFLIAKFFL